MRRHGDSRAVPLPSGYCHIAATVEPPAGMRITAVHELLQHPLPTRLRVTDCLNRGSHRQERRVHDRSKDTSPLAPERRQL
mgnify:CR=1